MNLKINSDYFDLKDQVSSSHRTKIQRWLPRMFNVGIFIVTQLLLRLIVKLFEGIHTSKGKGTRKRNCHQDWLMGRCGQKQEAAGPAPKGKGDLILFILVFNINFLFKFLLGNHGLCPYFYNSAFTNDFYATENIYECSSRRTATNYPEFFKMGYLERRKR